MTEVLIFLNIMILEIVLSIDNAAVLAAMVKELPKEQQKKALTYGIAGAYVFRGLALAFASILIKLVWLKVAGGLYLMYLAYKALSSNVEQGGESKMSIKIPFLSALWSTIVAIEMMDLVFSIDNVFAAVAFTPNLWLICGGVFVGILAMRFATTKFVKVLEKNPILERVAYWVIGALGLKLVSSYWLHDLNTESIDAVFSILTLLAFVVPLIIKKK
jgi:YkoY family integral membrane protein